MYPTSLNSILSRLDCESPVLWTMEYLLSLRDEEINFQQAEPDGLKYLW